MKELDIFIIFLILLLIYKLINNKTDDDDIENFDESKIKTGEFAQDRLKEFNHEKFKPYIEKYFKKLDIIDVRKIPVKNDGLIYCSVASYRDKQCPLTVSDMIKKAKDPTRLVICICQQNDGSDDSCFDNYDFKGAKIKKITMTDREARGPCWARYLIQQAWTGEEYFLQIDSHMRFAQDWDQKCIDQIALLPPKSCLTNYVSNFNLQTGLPDETNQLRGPLTIDNKESSIHDGFFRVNSKYVEPAEKPFLAYGWGACFSFSKSDIIQDAPYDAYTQFLFFGEEMDIWARMYTRGWYVYAPSTPICFTSFDRSYRPTFWENPDQGETEYLCRLRLYYRFGYLKDIPEELKIDINNYNYNLGSEKTWHQYLSFCLDEPTERV
jgi:hypothetical protein